MFLEQLEEHPIKYLPEVEDKDLGGDVVNVSVLFHYGARCSSVVRAFVHGAMGRRIDPSWWNQSEI